eukprot:1139145-Pelagomonas_calceolata.AAC.4
MDAPSLHGPQATHEHTSRAHCPTGSHMLQGHCPIPAQKAKLVTNFNTVAHGSRTCPNVRYQKITKATKGTYFKDVAQQFQKCTCFMDTA